MSLQDILHHIEVKEAGLPETLPENLRGEITTTIAMPTTYTGKWHLKSKVSAGFDTHCSKTAQRVCYWLSGTNRYLIDILRQGEPLASWTFDEDTCLTRMQVIVFDIIEHKFVVVAGIAGEKFLLLQSNLNDPKLSLGEWLSGTFRCGLPLIMMKDHFMHMLRVLQGPQWPTRQQLGDLFGAEYPPYNPMNATVVQFPLRDAFNTV